MDEDWLSMGLGEAVKNNEIIIRFRVEGAQLNTTACSIRAGHWMGLELWGFQSLTSANSDDV